MIDIQNDLVVENIYDLVRKEIHGKYTDEQVRKYKRYGSEWFKDDKYLYAHEDIMTPIIMYCKESTPKATEFRSKSGFKQHDIVLSKEQSVISKIMKKFSNEKTLPQLSVLSYQIDFYFPEHKLATEVDEKQHDGRKIDCEIKSQKAIEKELGCEFIRINPDRKDYDGYVEIGKIYNHVIKSTKDATKKSLINNLSRRLLELEFNSNHLIKFRALKYVANKILPSVQNM